MQEKMPRTPFSIHLSGSAKETELRIRNIMTGPKKRPPLPFLILMFSICIFCGNLVSCQIAETPPDNSGPVSSRQEETVPAQKDRAVPRLERREGVYTFLLTAGTGEGAPTDSFMVLCYDTQRQTAGLVSIPRDTLVELDGQAVRLNRVQSGLEQCLSRTLGIPIDYRIDIGIDGFAALVDELGGIDFYIPQDMDYDDPFQDLSIHFKAGPAHLNGQQTVAVARFRKNNNGSAYSDLGRVQTQQKLMEALAQKLLSWDSVTKIDGFVDFFGQNVETDLSVADMLYFAGRAGGLDLSDGLETDTLPLRTPAVSENYIPGQEPDPEPALELVNRLLNPYTQDMTLEDMNLASLSG